MDGPRHAAPGAAVFLGPDGGRRSGLGLASPRGEERVHRGEGEEGEGSRGDEAADDHARERLLVLRADAVAKGGGKKADDRHDGGDDDGPEADLARQKSICAQPMGVSSDMHDRWAPAVLFEFANRLIL